MRIKRKNEFGDLKTAVFYEFEYFIPDPEYKIDPTLVPDKSSSQIESMNYFLSKGRIENSPRFKAAILTDLGGGKFRAKKRLIQGSKKRFDGIDFAEYDFNVVLEDQKFNNRDLISYLDKETASLVGTSLGSLEKINSTLFPTLSNSDVQANDIEYFGTLSLSAITLYLFNLDPEMYKIELYEDVIEENNSAYGGFIESDVLDVLGIEHTSPVVTIYLGPNQECKNNTPSVYGDDLMYSINDPLKNNRSNYYEYDPLEYSKKCDEIYAGKSVWLALSSDKSIKEVNLSYNAWLQSEDANIFKNKFNLRNDDYYDKTKSHYLEEGRGDFIDKRSGKLLGNKIMAVNKEQPGKSSCPLLSRKLRNLDESLKTKNRTSEVDENDYMYLPSISSMDESGYVIEDIQVDSDNYAYFLDTEDYRNYCPEVEYEPGTLVYHNGQSYRVLKKGNRGHFPDISSYWALDNKVNELYTTRVTIINKPQKAGNSTPNRQITVVDEKKLADMSFAVTSNIGFEFSTVMVEGNDGEQHNLDLSKYTVSDVTDGESYYKLVTILEEGWEDILDADSRKRIIFNYNEIASLVNLMFSLDDNGMISTGNIEIHGFNDSPVASQEEFYKIVLGALVKNGTRYETSDTIDAQLRTLSIDDEIELEFALIDYKHNGASRFTKAELTKKAKGEAEIESAELELTSKEWIYASGRSLVSPILHIPSRIEYDELEVKISAGTKMDVTVSEYTGFEVDKVNSKTNYNEPFTLRFYGTYGDKFQSIEIYNKVLNTDDIGNEITITVSDRPVKLKLSKSGTMYTLEIDKVVKDADIKIYEK